MDQSIQNLLTGLATGTLTVPIAQYLLNRFPNFTKGQKRLFALAISFLLATFGHLALIRLGYTPAPADTQAWLEVLSTLAGIAFTTSQLVLSGVRSEAVKEAIMEIEWIRDFLLKKN